MNFHLPALAPKITDWRDRIPKRPTPVNEKMGTLLGLVIHHEGSSRGTLAIADYHVNNPKDPKKPSFWAHIGYNWTIEMDGTVYYVLDLESATPYHAGYTEIAGDDLTQFPNQDPQFYNYHYWAVCLIGDLSKAPPTRAQTDSLARLIAALKTVMGPGFEIVGHNELPGKKTECPGKNLSMDWVRSQVAKLLAPIEDLGKIAFPQEGDEDWLKKFPNTREAAIAMKGVADNFGNILVGVKNELQKIRGEPVWSLDARILELIKKIQVVTG